MVAMTDTAEFALIHRRNTHTGALLEYQIAAPSAYVYEVAGNGERILVKHVTVNSQERAVKELPRGEPVPPSEVPPEPRLPTAADLDLDLDDDEEKEVSVPTTPQEAAASGFGYEEYHAAAGTWDESRVTRQPEGIPEGGQFTRQKSQQQQSPTKAAPYPTLQFDSVAGDDPADTGMDDIESDMDRLADRFDYEYGEASDEPGYILHEAIGLSQKAFDEAPSFWRGTSLDQIILAHSRGTWGAESHDNWRVVRFADNPDRHVAITSRPRVAANFGAAIVEWHGDEVRSLEDDQILRPKKAGVTGYAYDGKTERPPDQMYSDYHSFFESRLSKSLSTDHLPPKAIHIELDKWESAAPAIRQQVLSLAPVILHRNGGLEGDLHPTREVLPR